MKNTEITIEDVRNLDEKSKELLDIARGMTNDDLDLLLEIIALIENRPDREQYVVDYIDKKMGKMTDLPEILIRI